MTHSFPTRSSSDLTKIIFIIMKNLLNIFVSLILSLILLSNTCGIALQQQANAHNIGENPTTEEEKNYILVFGQRTVGNVDNSTKIVRSEEHTSELQSLMRISNSVFCLKKKK